MKTSNLTKTIKFSLLPLLLFLNVACMITPDGDFAVAGGVGVNLTPQIMYSDSSYVTVRVGPSFYASDAYLVAYNYCLDRGLYAYEYSSWAHSSSAVRDLRYDCRSSYIAPPLVYNIDRRNRYRYDYFHNDYYRNHRPGYHYQQPSSGWWGKNNNDRYNPPTRPPHVNPSPGYTRDGRAVTPQSPWSYNPGKNSNRYQPRSSYQGSQPSSGSSPTYSSPLNSSPTNNKWWGRSAASPSRPSVSPTPKLEAPKSSGGSFWGGGKKSESSSSPRYGSSEPSRPSRSDSGSGSGSSSGGSSGKPGWWGKN